jgi:hypothetical protein
MADKPEEAAEIKETDIVFDCPYCSKSLAIDYRGAGLTIQCTDCGRNVVVPIPEGMELTDIDSSEEEQEIRILNLRRAVTTAESRIRELEAQVAQLKEQAEGMDKALREGRERFTTILEKVAVIQRAQADIFRALDVISEVARERK